MFLNNINIINIILTIKKRLGQSGCALLQLKSFKYYLNLKKRKFSKNQKLTQFKTFKLLTILTFINTLWNVYGTKILGIYSWTYAKYLQNVLFREHVKSAYFRSASWDRENKLIFVEGLGTTMLVRNYWEKREKLRRTWSHKELKTILREHMVKLKIISLYI